MAENSGISHEYESYELEMTFRGLLLPDEELIWCARSHKKINLFVLSLIKQIETAGKKAGIPEIEIEGQSFRQMTAGM